MNKIQNPIKPKNPAGLGFFKNMGFLNPENSKCHTQCLQMVDKYV